MASTLITTKIFFLILLVGFTSFDDAQAHPTSYEGSVGIMGRHSPGLNHVQINYSWRYWAASGLHYFKAPEISSESDAAYVSANFLLRRWNTKKLQANLYFAGGPGLSRLQGKSKNSGMGLVQFDIEDRRLYFLAKHQILFNKDDYELQLGTIRFGIAPYVAPAGDIHTWLIAEYSAKNYRHHRGNEDVTTLLRFFYKNMLFEIGQSFKGETKFNYITHI